MAQLQQTIDGQEQAVQEETSETEQALKDAKKEAAEQKKTAERTAQAYEALLTAKSCEFKEGNVTYAKAMETLKNYQQYLSEQGLAEYEALLQD